jgi:predicted nucleic acid-binding protein
VAVFVDTSAIFAFLDADDDRHAAAVEIWGRLALRSEQLVTQSYIVVESSALIQRRLGWEALRDFLEVIVPLFAIVWIDESLQAAASAALLTSGKRGLSLVDCASFEVMRRTGVRTFFAYDAHFAEMGFETVED